MRQDAIKSHSARRQAISGKTERGSARLELGKYVGGGDFEKRAMDEFEGYTKGCMHLGLLSALLLLVGLAAFADEH